MAGLNASGTYTCRVSNDCSEAITAEIPVTIRPYQLTLLPGRLVAPGLDPLRLAAVGACLPAGSTVEWQDMENGHSYGPDTNPITLDPLPATSRDFRVTITDQGQILLTDRVRVLIASDPLWLDPNRDGMNSMEDWYLLAGAWRTEMSSQSDPDGDGRMTVLDFLYVHNGSP